MPNPDGTPDSIAEALAQPADFTDVPADADQSIAHRDIGLPKHYQGLLPGQRPYPWRCPACGTDQHGHVEAGCVACGAGKDGKMGRPEPAVDPICRACRGAKTISVKCKQCDGTGDERTVAGGPDQDPQPCIDCGGAGMLTIDCRRCKETPGFDPEPQKVIRAAPPDQFVTAAKPYDLTGMARIMSEKPLPTIEDDERWQRATQRPRFFLMEVPADGGKHTVVEIAASPKVLQVIQEAKEIK